MEHCSSSAGDRTTDATHEGGSAMTGVSPAAKLFLLLRTCLGAVAHQQAAGQHGLALGQGAGVGRLVHPRIRLRGQEGGLVPRPQRVQRLRLLCTARQARGTCRRTCCDSGLPGRGKSFPCLNYSHVRRSGGPGPTWLVLAIAATLCPLCPAPHVLLLYRLGQVRHSVTGLTVPLRPLTAVVQQDMMPGRVQST